MRAARAGELQTFQSEIHAGTDRTDRRSGRLFQREAADVGAADAVGAFFRERCDRFFDEEEGETVQPAGGIGAREDRPRVAARAVVDQPLAAAEDESVAVALGDDVAGEDDAAMFFLGERETAQAAV